MGLNISTCCRDRKLNNFTTQERKSLKVVFRALKRDRRGDKDGNAFSLDAWKGLFNKTMKQIPKKMYRFLQARTPEPHEINFDSF